MSGSDRLASILSERMIRAMKTYFAQVPVVCFTESTRAGLEYMIGAAGFEPWGVVFHRETVFDRGGGPVFHLRGDEWGYRETLPLSLQSRIVKFAPGEAEWVEEREWRISYTEDDHGFSFEPPEIEAVIVGDRDWPPTEERLEMVYTLGGWEPGIVEGPPAWFHDFRRLWWDGVSLRDLA